MIDVEEAKKRAEQNFLSGLNCTQSVAEVFAEELGFDRQQILKISLPFGGGVCRMREMCGTFSGIMFCLGMYLGESSGDKTAKDNIYRHGQELARRFKEKNGSIICRELLGLVPMGTSDNLFKEKKTGFHEADSPVSEQRTAEYYKKRPCPQLCGIAAEIFASWLNENRPEK